MVDIHCTLSLPRLSNVFSDVAVPVIAAKMSFGKLYGYAVCSEVLQLFFDTHLVAHAFGFSVWAPKNRGCELLNSIVHCPNSKTNIGP